MIKKLIVFTVIFFVSIGCADLARNMHQAIEDTERSHGSIFPTPTPRPTAGTPTPEPTSTRQVPRKTPTSRPTATPTQPTSAVWLNCNEVHSRGFLWKPVGDHGGVVFLTPSNIPSVLSGATLEFKNKRGRQYSFDLDFTPPRTNGDRAHYRHRTLNIRQFRRSSDAKLKILNCTFDIPNLQKRYEK